MSHYHAHTGFWIDSSYSILLGATITLPMRWANILISVLTLSVALSASSFWAIAAYLLHHSLINRKDTTVIALQHQVILRNSKAPFDTLWDIIKVYLTWRKRSTSGAMWRPFLHAGFALLVWISFIAAGVFVSNVASNAYTNIETLLVPNNCGSWHFDISTQAGIGARSSKMLRDTIRGRAYAGSWYDNSSTSLGAVSLFPVNSLPYDTTAGTSCPFSVSRCLKGQNTSFSMGTPLIDSHSMFGINAPEKDRVQFQKNVTCANVQGNDLFEEVEVDGKSMLRFYLGPNQNVSNFTFQYDLALANSSVEYMLSPFASNAGSVAVTWDPDPLFNRTDADVSMFFLTQNSVLYSTPVLDPWFFANGTIQNLVNEQVFSSANGYVSILGCIDQYSICNPTTGQCTPHGGLEKLDSATKALGLNDAQIAVAARLVNAASGSSTFESVFGMGSSALLAKEVLFDTLSPGLPAYQWTLEATRWFTTSLAKMQGSMVEYAYNEDLGPYAVVAKPANFSDQPTAVRKVLSQQCEAQRIRTSGEAQSFSVLGLGIVIGASILLTLLSWGLGTCMQCVRGRSDLSDRRAAARQVDDKLHLLRLALEDEADLGPTWGNGSWDVPLTSQHVDVERPTMGLHDLASYSTNVKNTI